MRGKARRRHPHRLRGGRPRGRGACPLRPVVRRSGRCPERCSRGLRRAGYGPVTGPQPAYPWYNRRAGEGWRCPPFDPPGKPPLLAAFAVRAFARFRLAERSRRPSAGCLTPPPDHRRSRASISRASPRRDRRPRGRRCHRFGAGPPGFRDGLRPSLPPGSSRRADTDGGNPRGLRGAERPLARPPCSTRRSGLSPIIMQIPA